jgi:hypothetical protein
VKKPTYSSVNMVTTYQKVKDIASAGIHLGLTAGGTIFSGVIAYNTSGNDAKLWTVSALVFAAATILDILELGSKLKEAKRE